MGSSQIVSGHRQAVITPSKRVAVVLSGCGAMDGAEITESTSLLIQLSQRSYAVSVFAPDRAAAHTVDHRTGAVSEEGRGGRNMLTEAARIARGQIQPLSELRAAAFDAVAFAGGYGAAKNLCNFAFVGEDATLQSDVKEVLCQFWEQKKVMGALCVAPVLLGLLAREKQLTSVRLTLGDGSDAATVATLKKWGVTHVPCAVREACVDPVNRLVSSPAYMLDNASPADVFASAEALVAGMAQLLTHKG